MELHREDPTSPPPTPLSGAYIRSLVKELTTTKPKETMKNKDPCCVSPSQKLRKNVKNQQQKKQVRRRLHTTKPYQERLLNMAEARKEIVTALKFHRATMKQATQEQQQQQERQRQQQQQELFVASFHNPSHISSFEQDVKSNSRRNPRIYPSCTSNFSNGFSYTPFLVPNSYTSFYPPLVVENENSNFTLPNQTLGLNLNLHDFNNLDATLLDNNNSSSTSSSSSPPLSFVIDKDCAPEHFPVVVPDAPPDSSIDVQSIGISQGEGVSSTESSATTQVNGVGYHIAIDDELMEEMRSLGEQYQMELNDTINFVTSSLWFNFLNNMENDGIAHQVNSEDDALNHHVFDELNAEESCFEKWSEDYFQNLNLPW